MCTYMYLNCLPVDLHYSLRHQCNYVIFNLSYKRRIERWIESCVCHWNCQSCTYKKYDPLSIFISSLLSKPVSIIFYLLYNHVWGCTYFVFFFYKELILKVNIVASFHNRTYTKSWMRNYSIALHPYHMYTCLHVNEMYTYLFCNG